MEKRILSSIFCLVLSCLSFVIQSQDITLQQTNKSGIYTKGQKITVTASTDNYVDTLHIKVFKNNNKLLVQKDIITGKDSLLIYEGSFADPC